MRELWAVDDVAKELSERSIELFGRKRIVNRSTVRHWLQTGWIPEADAKVRGTKAQLWEPPTIKRFINREIKKAQRS